MLRRTFFELGLALRTKSTLGRGLKHGLFDLRALIVEKSLLEGYYATNGFLNKLEYLLFLFTFISLDFKECIHAI